MSAPAEGNTKGTRTWWWNPRLYLGTQVGRNARALTQRE
jgi:hypothetical protein